MEKRILSVCLTACMLLTLMPSAFAADAEQPLPIAGMEQTEETSADARTEPGDEPQEPVPTEEGKGTQEEPFTTVAAYNEAVKGDALDGKDVYLTISRTEFKEGQFALTNVQTRPNPPRLHLTLTDCTFTGNTAGDKTNSSFMYLPNCQSLVIKGCTSGSFKRPARRCSVPIYPCPQVFAVVFANLRAFSACLVNCLSMSSPICFHHIRQKSHQ